MNELYLNYNFYKNVYLGETLSDSDFSRYVRRAQRAVEASCYGRIAAAGFNNLTARQQYLVRLAICYQADFLMDYGQMINAPISSFAVGSTSMSLKENGSIAQNALCEESYRLLEESGLSCLVLR